MNSFLLYILESSVCISVLYLLFRIIMRKESSFGVNRTILLMVIVVSMVIPFLQLPQQMQTPVNIDLFPELQVVRLPEQNQTIDLQNKATVEEIQPIPFESTHVTAPGKKFSLSTIDSLKYIYLAGELVALTLLIRNIILILMLFREARVVKKDDYRLLIVDGEVPSFAFGHSVMISQKDFDLHGSAIITHEQSHIRLNHFYDLILLELVRIFHWFNPLVYHLIRDMKEIHEYQADNSTLQSGIDATKYQLLIIQKSVGPKRFALANSFNHCQIKNRIVMMNKLKNSKAWRWKVAAFLPLLALLLMAFGKPGENVPPKKSMSTETVSPVTQDKAQKVKEGIKLTPPPLFIDIKKDGIYLMKKLVSLDELKKQLPEVVSKNPQSEVWVDIIDAFNSDLPAVRNIINKECDSKKVKYIRFTQKFTPPETSDLKLPKRNTFSIRVDAKGRVFVGFDGQENRQKLLTRMGEDYNIVFSPKELEEFSKIDSFGVPMNRMKAFLKMPAEERNKPENTIGIPYNSGNNEFKNWVRAARTVNKGMYITFKGDPTTSYKVIDQLIETLQDLHENRYYMTFPEWSTAYEIAFPSKSKPEDDKTGKVKKFTESAVQDLAKTRPNVITVIPDKDNSIYYYLGTQDAKGNNPVLHKTDYSPSGIHEFLINRNHDVFAKVEALRKKKENGELSKEDFEKQRVEIMHDKSAPIVLIKPTDASNFGNFMNILYEMSICEMTRYAVIDLSAYDKNLISKAR